VSAFDSQDTQSLDNKTDIPKPPMIKLLPNSVPNTKGVPPLAPKLSLLFQKEVKTVHLKAFAWNAMDMKDGSIFSQLPRIEIDTALLTKELSV
jgi:hypothetical protein